MTHSRGGPLDQLAPVSQPSPAEGKQLLIPGNPPPPLAPSRLPTAPGAPGGSAEACPGTPLRAAMFGCGTPFMLCGAVGP